MRKLIQQYAKDLTAGRLASGYEHSYRLYRLARQIGESLDYYDDEILHAACFLHDLDITARHPEASAEKARAILEETGFTPGKIQAVYVAILNHMPICSTLSAPSGLPAWPSARFSGFTTRPWRKCWTYSGSGGATWTVSTFQRAVRWRGRRSSFSTGLSSSFRTSFAYRALLVPQGIGSSKDPDGRDLARRFQPVPSAEALPGSPGSSGSPCSSAPYRRGLDKGRPFSHF
jgi:hypothetical protein